MIYRILPVAEPPPSGHSFSGVRGQPIPGIKNGHLTPSVRNPCRSRVILRSAAAVTLLALMGPIARAADFVLTASGTIRDIFSESSTFDGTNFGVLPPLLDVDRLAGGTFTASYWFSEVVPDQGSEAFYTLSASSGMTYDLLDASDNLVHRGSDSTYADAYIQSNQGSAPFTVDQVLLTAAINDTTGSHIPTPLYGLPQIFSIGDFSFSGYVDGSVDYISNLAIPTDAATYQAFPTKLFDVFFEFSDGDVFSTVNPYQYANITLQGDITTFTVTPVPEPATILLFTPALLIFGLTRRR